ncbi:MAG: hypothetical protein R3324_11080, partial [Halobacteriales archaeon]|nr:hypothetical protein [Halobacteriales archaeon]
FFEVFGLGGDHERIATVDADGVALAAIQGLAEEVDDLRERLEARDQELTALREQLADRSAAGASGAGDESNDAIVE